MASRPVFAFGTGFSNIQSIALLIPGRSRTFSQFHHENKASDNTKKTMTAAAPLRKYDTIFHSKSLMEGGLSFALVGGVIILTSEERLS